MPCLTHRFLKTETILRTNTMVFSYVQVRGSVPRAFLSFGPSQARSLESTRTQSSGRKSVYSPSASRSPSPDLSKRPSLPSCAISRVSSTLSAPPPLSTLAAGETPLTDARPPKKNSDGVHVINLLSTKDQEALLTEAYATHIDKAGLRSAEGVGIGMTAFDFHARSKVGGIESVKSQLANVVGSIGQRFGACVATVEGRGEDATTLVMSQQGVFRTNCKGATLCFSSE